MYPASQQLLSEFPNCGDANMGANEEGHPSDFQGQFRLEERC